MKLGKLFKSLVPGAIFAFVLFLSAELTLRVYYFGPAGIYPSVVNSFTNIFSSGIVKAADNLEVWYELKPDQNILYHGAQLSTNTRGLRDNEYALSKADDTYRVAVIGSSWSMGTGVENHDIFHSVMERDLTEATANMQYEFINFGVEFYGLGEMVATAKHKAMQYDPDMIMLVITDSTPWIRWDQHDETFAIPANYAPATIFYSVLKLRQFFGIAADTDRYDMGLRNTLTPQDNDQVYAQQSRAFKELAKLSADHDTAVAIVRLRSHTDNIGKGNKVQQKVWREMGFKGAVVNLDEFLQPGDSPSKLMINRADPHPNKLGHQYIAAELQEILFQSTSSKED
jgi:hypothetical protein